MPTQNEQQLFEAVKNGNISEVSKLLSEGKASINALDKNERNPLAIATNLGNTKMVECLIGYGAANVAKKIVDAKLNDLIKTEYLILNNGVNAVLDEAGSTPLHFAARYGFKEAVKILLERGADVNAQNKYKNSPLHSTLSFGYNGNQLDIVKHLVDKGANVIEANEFGETPLYIAANSQCPAGLAQCLINAGADVKAFSRGDTPLHIAVRNLSSEVTRYDDKYNGKNIIEILTEAGADINAANRSGATPLHLAIHCNKVFKGLIDKGADINARDSKDGESVLHTAISHLCMDSVKHLMEKKADLEISDNCGNTPLHAASKKKGYWTTFLHPDIKMNEVELVKLLVENGAKINATNNRNRTPLFIAAEEHKDNIVDELLKHSPDVSVENDEGKTPLDIAREKGYTTIVNLLTNSTQVDDPQVVQQAGASKSM